eukprot:1640385-Pyramimonas_sp.AAC.1
MDLERLEVHHPAALIAFIFSRTHTDMAGHGGSSTPCPGTFGLEAISGTHAPCVAEPTQNRVDSHKLRSAA